MQYLSDCPFYGVEWFYLSYLKHHVFAKCIFTEKWKFEIVTTDFFSNHILNTKTLYLIVLTVLLFQTNLYRRLDTARFDPTRISP